MPRELPKHETIGGEESSGDEKRRPKQADVLIGLCGDLELHHDADGMAYATWHHNGARITHRLRSIGFKSWLSWRAHKDAQLTPSANAMQEALNVLEGRAVHDGPLVQVHRRVAEHEGCLYLDLCNSAWQVVQIDAKGWRVVSDPPVRFVRGTGMLPLPLPSTSGSLGALRPFLNVVDDADFDVCVAWLIGAVQAKGPFPILALSGVQGSAKSTAAELLIGCVDPNKVPLRSLPKSEDDLVVAVQHGRVIGLDNVSGLTAEMSDAICRLATGAGVAKRKLYSDDEAVILDACAPVVMTGIGSYIARGDAADRALPVTLRKLKDNEYRPKRELLAEFTAALPVILGGLCDALSCSIRRRAEVQGRTRLADFEQAVEAAGPALGWQPGHFNRLLASVRDRSRRAHIEDDELAQSLLALGRDGWEGTVERLRQELSRRANAVSWLPRTAKALGNAIRRLEPPLEHVGLIVRRFKRGDDRVLALEWLAPNDAPNAPQVPEPASKGLPSGGASDGTSAYQSGVRNLDLQTEAPSNVQRAANAPPPSPIELNPAAHAAHAARPSANESPSDEELSARADAEADRG